VHPDKIVSWLSSNRKISGQILTGGDHEEKERFMAKVGAKAGSAFLASPAYLKTKEDMRNA